MRIAAAAGGEVGLRIGISAVRPRVELAVPLAARLTELRMEGEALEAGFAASGLDTDLPLRIVDVDVPGDRPAVVADRVDRTAHVVDEDAARARLIDQAHHARGLSIDIRDRGELDEVDPDHTPRLRKSEMEKGRWTSVQAME